MGNLLTKEQVDFFQENGFIQIDNIFSEEEINELSIYLDEAMNEESSKSPTTDTKSGSYYKVLNQKVNTWRDHGGMARYSMHRRPAQIAMELSQANGIRLFHDHGLWKMPGDSKHTPWHQDFPYWPMNGTNTISAWIPMHDVDEENGCMMFVPGSHKIGKLDPINLADPQDIYDFVNDEGLKKVRPVKVPLKKGSCTFHHGLTFHYAHSNQTADPRRVLAIIYMADDVIYTGKKHLVTDDANLTPDEPFKGGRFPLLASR